MKKAVATITARMASTRLPGKAMAQVVGKPLLELLIERVARAGLVDELVVATTTEPQDDCLEALAMRSGVGCHRGSADDVLGRVLDAALAHGGEDLVVLTGDNPLVDPELIDDVLAFFQEGRFDYVTTTHMHHSRNWGAMRTFPVGVSVQVCATSALADAAARTADPAVREHATFAVYDHPERYRLGAFDAIGKYAAWRHPELRLTVDTPEDLALVRAVFEALYPANPSFSTEEAIRLVAETPALRSLNGHVRQRLAHEEAVTERRT